MSPSATPSQGPPEQSGSFATDAEVEPAKAAAKTETEVILIGLSGPSSSGKTTLARLLREIFNLSISEGGRLGQESKISLFVLHQDDFYKTDTEVPTITVSSSEFGTRNLQDWDCVESLDLPLLEHTLAYIRDHAGHLPPDRISKEDQNTTGESGVSAAEIETFKGRAKTWWEDVVKEAGRKARREIKICILDGFLLYPHPPPPSSSPAPSPPTTSEIAHLYALSRNLLQLRLFLPSTRSQTLTRRAARSGYVTLEGFWTDPPGYVEDVVWPNYARDHAWMYTDKDVEGGKFDETACAREDVHVCPGGGSWAMKECLEWAVERVKGAVRERVLG